jgi:hypothetical protein
MEYYSAIKKNEIMLFAGKWMELENTMLSKVSLAQNVEGHVFSFIVEARAIYTYIYIQRERERERERERLY